MAKSRSQLVNLPGAQPLMNPLIVKCYGLCSHYYYLLKITSRWYDHTSLKTFLGKIFLVYEIRIDIYLFRPNYIWTSMLSMRLCRQGYAHAMVTISQLANLEDFITQFVNMEYILIMPSIVAFTIRDSYPQFTKRKRFDKCRHTDRHRKL